MDTVDHAAPFKEVLRSRLKSSGIPQRLFSEKCGFSQALTQALLTGRTYPQPDKIDRMTQALGLTGEAAAEFRHAAALALPVARVLTDAGISAKSLEGRPAVQEAMGAVDRGEVAGIIVYKLDRLTRSRRDLEDLLDRFAKAGAGLISVSEKLDTSSPMGRFFVAMLGAIAQWERETIAERVTMGIRHRKAQGYQPHACRRPRRGDHCQHDRPPDPLRDPALRQDQRRSPATRNPSPRKPLVPHGAPEKYNETT